MAGSNVAKKEEGALAAASFFEDAGSGFENVGSADIIIPFMKLAQSLSDEVKKTKPEYIDGLEEGDFFNSATNAVFKREDGFDFVPVHYERQYLQFAPNRGGFEGMQDSSIMDHTERNDKGQNLLANGSEIVEAACWYIIVLSKDGPQQAVMSMSKSQMQPSRKLMTNLKQVQLKTPDGKGTFTPPLFYNVVHATSTPKSNDQGDWMVWDFSIAGNVESLEDGESIYAGAKAMRAAVISGAAKAAPPSVDGQGGMDDEIPF